MDARAALNEFRKYLALKFNRKAAAADHDAALALESGDEDTMRAACRTAHAWITKSTDRPAALLSWLEEGTGDPKLFG